MKAIHKKALTGALAAGLLIGGGLVLQHNQVFADETGTASTTTTTTTDSQNGSQHKGFFKDFKKGGFLGGFAFGKGSLDLASILGIDQTTLKDEIKQGKTLAQIAQEKAGLTEDALLQKLTEAETKKIDDALSAGKITQAQADKQKAGLADRLKKMVEAKPKAGGFEGKRESHFGLLGAWGKSDEIAKLLGMTKEELITEQKAGKSLADIAQEKGMTEDQLIAKLKDNMTDALKKFVERKGNTHQDGSKLKENSVASPIPTATP